MRIAVCDDDKEIRDMLAEKIGKLYPEADLWLYRSGEELLSSDKEPDILLLDIQMPGSNGMETAQRLRSRGMDTIIIFVSALEDYVFQAFDVGAFHYLVKPFTAEKLSEVLKKAVEAFEEFKKQAVRQGEEGRIKRFWSGREAFPRLWR